MERLAWIVDELAELDRLKLLRSRATRESPPVAGMIQIDGRQFINFGSNDYLGIAASEELVLATQNSVSELGFGSGASPLVNGRGTIHRTLELSIADFEERESALLFPTGYAANVGTLGSLLGKEDVVYSDEWNHASIIDGCRLSGATIQVFKHGDMKDLERLLGLGDSYRRKLIVTDSLFSMDGDFAKLEEICELAERNDCMVMVDEAHATGVFGKHGKGVCEMLNVGRKVDVVVGTLSKAIGCMGGFVAGSEKLVELIYNRARSYVFSTAQPEVIAAAAIQAMQLVIDGADRRAKLLENSEFLRRSLVEMGFDIGASSSQIVPVILGGNCEVVEYSVTLLKSGVFVPAIRPPSVPQGKSRLRISLSSSHKREQIVELLSCLKNLKNS